MAKNNGFAVIAVLSDLSEKAAANISRDIMRSKQKHTSSGRGTIATGLMSNVSKMLQSGHKQIGGKK